MRNLLTTCLLLLCAFALRAQDNDSLQVHNNILFFKDPRVDVLQRMFLRKAPGSKKAIRVQIFQASSRDKVFEAKTQFSARFPGIVTYVSYAPPNFKLRAGEFETQQEALKFMQQVKPYFPASFVIEEKAADEEKKPRPKNY